LNPKLWLGVFTTGSGDVPEWGQDLPDPQERRNGERKFFIDRETYFLLEFHDLLFWAVFWSTNWSAVFFYIAD
jgi:hypothetical protein